MKKSSCGAVLVLLLSILCLSCQKKEVISPMLSAGQTKQAVLGKWKIREITYQLCRQGSCTNTNYKGTAQDFFEFRPDSAFLVHKTAANYQQHDSFKADYKLPGAFILTQGFWSAKYNVKECTDSKMVLECSYVGSDPYAKFTDTYYLYR